MRLLALLLLAASAVAQAPTDTQILALMDKIADVLGRMAQDIITANNRIGALEARQNVVPVWGAAYALSGTSLQAYAPQTVVGVQFYRNGLRQSSPVDFAWSTSGTVLTITPVDPPLADDTFVLDYEYRP